MKKVFAILSLALILVGPLCADEGQVCPSCECKCHTISGQKEHYDSGEQYYPYCSIYHDSRIKEAPEDQGPSWAARRDGAFSDEFMR